MKERCGNSDGIDDMPLECAPPRTCNGELLHWLRVVPNVSGSEIQQGRLQMVLRGWVGGHGGRRGHVVCGVHELRLGGSNGGIDVGPKLVFES